MLQFQPDIRVFRQVWQAALVLTYSPARPGDGRGWFRVVTCFHGLNADWFGGVNDFFILNLTSASKTSHTQTSKMQRVTVAVLLVAFAGAAMAFAPTTPALAGLRSGSALCNGAKLVPSCRATRVAPKMSMGLSEVASQALLVAGEGMEVSVAAYLAVLLGTFVPVVFLVTLYIQSESRKAATVDE